MFTVPFQSNIEKLKKGFGFCLHCFYRNQAKMPNEAEMDLGVPCVEEQLQAFQISSLKDEDLERNRVAAKVWSHLSQAKILMMVLAPSKRPGKLFLEWHWVMGPHFWAYYFGCWSDSKHKSHYGQQIVHRYNSLFRTTCHQVWELARRCYLGWLSSWRSMMNSA